MKIASFIFSIFFAFAAYAQEDSTIVPVNAEGRIMYRGVVEQQGIADSLYLRSINWLNTEYANPWDVSRERRREDGILTGIARLPLNGKDAVGNNTDEGLVEYTFTIESKDGRYRYTFTEFLHKRASRFPLERWLDKKDPQYSPLSGEYLRQVDEHINAKIESLKKGMQPKAKLIDAW